MSKPCKNTGYNMVTKQTHLNILIKKQDGRDQQSDLHVSWTIEVQCLNKFELQIPSIGSSANPNACFVNDLENGMATQ